MKVRELSILETVDSNFNGYGIGFLEGVLKANNIDRIAMSSTGGHRIYRFICTDDEYEKIIDDLRELGHWRKFE